MKNLQSILLLIGVFLLLFSCKESEDTDPIVPIIENPIRPMKGMVRTNLIGRVLDEQNNPLVGVVVKSGGKQTITDVNGIYNFTDVSIDGDRGYIEVSKGGFFDGQRIVEPYKDKLTQVPTLKLIEKSSIGTITASTGGKVGIAGGIQIELPANAVENYTGAINVVASYINPTSHDFIARVPGDLFAENSDGKIGMLESFGMAHIELLDNTGKELKLKAGTTAKITLPIPPSMVGIAPATMKMWSFDEAKGIWKEEGIGTKQGSVYVGEVSHFSVWNFDKWNPFRFIPISIKWLFDYLRGTISPVEDPDLLEDLLKDMEGGKRGMSVHVTRQSSGSTVYHRNLTYPNSTSKNPYTADYNEDLRLPDGLEGQEELVVKIYPLQPGGPEYPVNERYSPVPGETPVPMPEFVQTDDSQKVTKKYNADFTKSPTSKIEVVIPPVTPIDGKGAYIINVNGKSVNCDKTAVRQGYAYASLRNGNKVLASAYAPIFNDGLFTINYLMKQSGSDLVNNVVLTIYDVQSGKKSKDITVNVNPSLAYRFQENISVCNEPNDPVNQVPTKVFSGNYVINTPQQLKAFIDSAYTEVGGLTIGTAAINDLGGIISLKKIGGLVIDKTNIENLGGLAEVEEITGSMRIQLNGSLLNIAFPKLKTKSMQGGLYIHSNPSLQSITFPNLEEICTDGQELSIYQNISLSSISIPKFKSLGNSSQVTISNTLLKNLNFLTNVTGAPSGNLTIDENNELENLNGIQKIIPVRGVFVRGNKKLQSLNGLILDVQALEFTNIQNNPELNDISALTSKIKTGFQIVIERNPKLETVVFNNLEKVIGFSGIRIANSDGLKSIEFSKLNEIEGVLFFENLKTLTTVKAPVLGKIAQRAYFGTLTSLESLDLPELIEAFTLEFYNTSALKDINGFNKLEKLNQLFSVSLAATPASSLTSINGLKSLKTAGAVTISIDLNTSKLEEIKGLTSLTDVQTVFSLSGLPKLKEISGLGNLTTVGQDFHVNYTGLTNLHAFKKLNRIGNGSSGMFSLIQNNELTNLDGLEALKTCSQLSFNTNPKLTQINGLAGLEKIALGVSISSNKSLMNLDGLANWAGATINLIITSNEKLADLCGVTKIAKNGTVSNYNVNSNSYNPTLAQLKDGNCKK
ncbi:leucine-rich repeat protein [Algoriphagus sp.]|uniref:leucine-rich repeat protein n=1 Tax=Algoriphagus sp. TaxID=1872435 RepID=UPI0039195775